MGKYEISYQKLKNFIKNSNKDQGTIINYFKNESLLPVESRKTLNRLIEKEEKAFIDYETGKRIIQVITGKIPANVKQVLSSLHPYDETIILPEGEEGNAECGEIQLEIRSEENLVQKERHNPVQKYVGVYVDDVRFMQNRGNKNDPQPYPARYIRIEPPSGNPGAIILPIDLKREKVLLVTQYRHPQRCFLTEAPRGFGSMNMEYAAETARRELIEETGHFPIKNWGGSEELIPLKQAYTDTGKLVESPGFFLALVDRDYKDNQYLENRPVMEDPAWFNLGDFYRAVFQGSLNNYIEVECDFALTSSRRDYLRGQTPVDSGVLNICDMFTTNVALLAFPYIAKALREKYNEDKPIFTENGNQKHFYIENFLPQSNLSS